MTTAILWKGRQAVMVIGTAVASPNTTTTKYAQLTSTTDVTAWIKDFTISGPSGDVEKVDALGETSNFQNAFFEEKPWDIFELSGTAVFSAVAADQGLAAMGMSAAGTTTNTSWKQYQFGSSATANVRTQKGVGIRLTDQGNATQGSTDAVDICFNGGYFTKIGDYSATADGHVEQSFTFKCLPKNYYEEYQNS